MTNNKTLRTVFLICAGLSVGIAFLLVSVTASLVVSGIVPPDRCTPLVISAQSIGVLIGARAAAGKVKTRKFLSGMAVSGIVILLYLAIGIPFVYPTDSYAFVSVLFMATAGALGGFWGLPRKKQYS